jgi:RNA polymerase sigma factor (sigma-70 family)
MAHTAVPFDETNRVDLARWMAKSAEGDLDAFDVVVRTLHADVTGFVAVRLPVASLIEEVVQDTFVAVYQARGRYQAGGDVRAWVKGFARNLCLRARADFMQAHRQSGIPWSQVLQEVPLAAAEGDEDEEGLQRRTDLAHCLATLSTSLQHLLCRRYGEGVSLQDLATQQTRSYQALAKALERGLAQLRSCMQMRARERA